MTNKTIRCIGAALLVALWLGLTGISWFGSTKEFSDTERRPLATAPQLEGEAILEGSFMSDFESFTLDQFPLRDTFRSIKALHHFYALQQSDKDGLYIQDGYLADMDGDLDPEAMDDSIRVFTGIYNSLLKDSTENIYFAVIPDKNHYLSAGTNRPALDPAAVEDALTAGLPWATPIAIRHTLTKESYYRTDTHWRQEAILPTAQALLNGMGMNSDFSYTARTLDRPFYGVYYGQVAMPVEPDALQILESDRLAACTVANYTSGTGTPMGFYDLEGLQEAKDPYNTFLYGSGVSFVTIENPGAATDRELVLFRDSYGCSMAPLLVADYARVTVIDLRVVNPMAMKFMVDQGVFSFQNADVLFLYSTLVLNNPDSFQVG